MNFWPASNTIKNETGIKFINRLGINLVKYSSEFLAHIKKYLGHTGTRTNVQNNCIKLSGFGVVITRVFLHRKITRNISCREKFVNTKIISENFRTNPTNFFRYLLLYFRLNKTVNNEDIHKCFPKSLCLLLLFDLLFHRLWKLFC